MIGLFSSFLTIGLTVLLLTTLLGLGDGLLLEPLLPGGLGLGGRGVGGLGLLPPLLPEPPPGRLEGLGEGFLEDGT